MNRDIRAEIEATIQSHAVVLFMKGTPNMPMCGFSAAVVGALREAGAANFEAINVLADLEIREGVKQYSDWPTVPQLYIKGEFIGGCDIVREMHAKGELAPLIQRAVA